MFFLIGSAQPARDPENRSNEVIRFLANSATGTVSAVMRLFNYEVVKVRDLDNQLEVRHRFRGSDTCGGGSPRMELAIDLDGDRDSEGNVFVYFGTPPSFANCQAQTWLYEDFTGGDGITGLGPEPSTGDPGRREKDGGPNEELEVDTSQLAAPDVGEDPGPVIPPQPFVISWSAFETVLEAFPDHRVCSAAYVDDVGAPPFFNPAENTGVSHVDLLSIGDATLNGREDIATKPALPSDTCSVPVRKHD